MKKEDLIEVASFCHDRARLINQDLYIVRQILKLAAKYKEEIKVSPAFYTMILDSLERSIVIELAKLFDRDDSSLQVNKVLETIRDNIEWFPKTRRVETSNVIESNNGKIEIRSEKMFFDVPLEPEKRLNDLIFRKEELSNTIEKLRKLRNKVYAHNDKRVLLDGQEKWMKENGFSLDDVENLLGLAFDICDFVLVRLTGEGRHRKAINIDDFEKTLKYVQMGREHWNKEIEKLINKK